MVYISSVKFKTSRMLLRPLEISDAKNVYYNWASDYKAMSMLGLNQYSSLEETFVKLKQKIQNIKDGLSYRWCIDIGKDTCVGYVLFKAINVNSGIISYCVTSRLKNQGIATEAVSVVVDYIFSHCGVTNISAFCYKSNYASQSVLRKVGFEQTNEAPIGSDDIHFRLDSNEYVCPIKYNIKYIERSKHNEGN